MGDPATGDRPDELFAWRDRDIVLICQREGTMLVIARGWLRDDRISNIRRWEFSEERSFLGQVRRLVREVTEDDASGLAVAQDAARWLRESSG